MAKKVLLIDDSPTYLLLHRVILTGRTDYEILSASDSHTALCMVASTLPDLILLELSVSDNNGLEICRTVRHQPATSHIPIVVLSALDNPVWKAKASECGCAEYIVKPLSAHQLVALVHRYMESDRTPCGLNG